MSKGLTNALQGEIGAKNDLYSVWLDLQNINNAPSFSPAKTWHWTNLVRTLQAAHLRRALECHSRQPNSPTKKRAQALFFVSRIWLGLQDSNLRMTGPKPVALPLGEGPTMLKYYHKIRESSTKHDYINIS